MEKTYVFKAEIKGDSKKSGKPYRMIELHDPQSLENTTFFIQEDQKLDVTGISFKDRVKVIHGISVFGRETKLTIEDIKKIS